MLIGAKTANWLPYDAEVEYLQGDNNAYIDTRLRFNYAGELKFKFSGVVSVNTFNTLFGARYHPEQATRVFVGSQNEQGLSKLYLGIGSIRLLGTSSILVSEITGTYKDNIFSSNLFTDENENNFDVAYNIFIFALNNRGSCIEPTVARCHYFYMKSSYGEIDLIPVRVGSVGYMYDRVSRKLFGNAGTGAFVLGPDV